MSRWTSWRPRPRGRLPAHPGVAGGDEAGRDLEGDGGRGQGEEGVEVGRDRLGPPEQGVEQAHLSRRPWRRAVSALPELGLELGQLGQAALERGVRREQRGEGERPDLAGVVGPGDGRA